MDNPYLPEDYKARLEAMSRDIERLRTSAERQELLLRRNKMTDIYPGGLSYWDTDIPPDAETA